MESIPEENTNQSSNQTQEPQRIEISPLQLLVNAVFLAYQRGAYTMKEAGIIAHGIDYFTIETKQAIVPIGNSSTQSTQNNESSIDSETKSEAKSEAKSDKVIMQSQ